MDTTACQRCWLAQAHLVTKPGSARELHCRVCDNLQSFHKLIEKGSEHHAPGPARRPLSQRRA